MRSIRDLPPPTARARFAAPFGQRFLLTVDTEEEFDWDQPLTRDRHGLDHLARLAQFQQFCEDEGVVPVYLVDWPIANSPVAAEILRGPIAAGKAEVGVQLHPWVNPPFTEEVNQHNSFAGNDVGLRKLHHRFARLRGNIDRVNLRRCFHDESILHKKKPR